MAFPAGFSSTYFALESWSDRLDRWEADHAYAPFTRANRASIERRFADPNTKPRAVVNIRTRILIRFLLDRRYKNLYELEDERVGGPSPTAHRRAVDERVGIGRDTYFAAAAMGGVGVRYFGEYCMVLEAGHVPDDTQVLDRDSYDLQFAPLSEVDDEDIRKVLLGRWREVEDMIKLRVLPRVSHDWQLVTSGTMIGLALTDQEYIEVHLEAPFGPDEVDQVLEAPESTASEARIRERERAGRANALHESEWVRLRSFAAWLLEDEKVRHRVVTQDGRGYQWI